MNIKEIKLLLDLVREHDLAEFELEREGCRISLKKYSAPTIQSIPQAGLGPEFAAAAQPADASSAEVDDDVGTHTITAPIVGTFFSAASPDASAYVSSGDKITPNDTVCIIEAMKVMNEIKADVSGTIIELYVENGQAVEYGQPLFKVRL